MASIPESLKSLTPFIKRAEELDRNKSDPDSRIVAYFCRKFATETGLQMRATAGPEATPFLFGLLDALEKEKPTLGVTPQESKEKCEAFALKVFSKADEEDRAGLASKTTAKIFYSAQTFFEILAQFGEVSPEIQEKQKYSKWKATDIVNAIKEGRVPTPSGFGENPEPKSPPSEPKSPFSDNTPPSVPPLPSNPMFGGLMGSNMSGQYSFPGMNPPQVNYGGPSAALPQEPTSPKMLHSPQSSFSTYPDPFPPPSMPSSHPTMMHPNQIRNSFSSMTFMTEKNPTPRLSPQINDAIELSNFAIAAMKVILNNANDTSLAKERLQEALRRLG